MTPYGTLQDEQFMRRALTLALQGIGLTSPNPMVGAVVVREGRMVGEGCHRYADRTHAEVLALEAAGIHAQGATLYLNLEPCSHFGRTPPCCHRILESGIRRVVAAIEDPNPRVAGQGFRKLREAGLEVSIGLLEEEARKLNEAYCHYIVTGRPFVTLKAGMTLDGKIATAEGESRWITSPESRERAQLLRHAADAILVGIGTVRKDDPRLTDRSGLPRRRPLLRVVLNPQLQLPPGNRLLSSGEDGDIIMYSTASGAARHQTEVAARGLEVLADPSGAELLSLDWLLEELGRREITHLLVEGGGRTHFEWLRSGWVNRLVFFIAPKILGGVESVPVVGGAGFGSLEDAFPLRFSPVETVGPDLMVEAYPVGGWRPRREGQDKDLRSHPCS
jgi:diaminohydroxyphosphoribosylaminopyrimidine deaminase/5-amino-6-(5-phosphoribosylamino)uracil reductase